MRRRFTPLVLGYHAASADWPHALSLPPETIEAQVRRLLTKGFEPATALEAVGSHGKRLFAVTFDDALRSLADVVPLLEPEELGFEAAFAIPAFGSRDPDGQFALPRVGLFRGERAPRIFLKTSTRIRRLASATRLRS